MSLTRRNLKALAKAISNIPDVSMRHEIANSLGWIRAQFDDDFLWKEWFKACGLDIDGNSFKPL